MLQLNKLDQPRANIIGDPRLRTLFNNYITLDTAPRMANVSSQVQTGFKPYSAINSGDVTYYLTPTANVPYPPTIFGPDTNIHWNEAPFTPFKNILIPTATAQPDFTIRNNDMRKETYHRVDLMLQQQRQNTMFNPLLVVRR